MILTVSMVNWLPPLNSLAKVACNTPNVGVLLATAPLPDAAVYVPVRVKVWPLVVVPLVKVTPVPGVKLTADALLGTLMVTAKGILAAVSDMPCPTKSRLTKAVGLALVVGIKLAVSTTKIKLLLPYP